MKRTVSIILILCIALCLLPACSLNGTVTEFQIGDGLPVWKFNEPRHEKELPANAEELGLVKIFAGDEDNADIYVYEYEKNDMTLEEKGQEQAGEYQVTSSIRVSNDRYTATYIYFDAKSEEKNIVQAYIFEGLQKFVKICVRYKTDQLSIGESNLTFRIPKGYSVRKIHDDVFPSCFQYSSNTDYMPKIVARIFDKNYFTADMYDETLMKNITKEDFEFFAKDGWTLKETADVYASMFAPVKRKEMMNRNGFNIAFLGYTQDGILSARAIIDNGKDFVMLCADDKEDEFVHIISALIDSINH
ncbi:MAG: hypothetical protein KBS62_03725 [Oscillospiraceae bacterium]|nr:hypothetical protein [Candidatus Ruminococcus equi]